MFPGVAALAISLAAIRIARRPAEEVIVRSRATAIAAPGRCRHKCQFLSRKRRASAYQGQTSLDGHQGLHSPRPHARRCKQRCRHRGHSPAK
jgi:hypothetical protein